MELRGFRAVSAEEWEEWSAEKRVRREHRSDVYLVVEDDAFNVKLRYGRQLEVKCRLDARRRHDGAEYWIKFMAHLPLQLDDFAESARLVLSRHPEPRLQLAARHLEGECWQVHVDKIRESSYCSERTLLRITHGTKEAVHYYETICWEGGDQPAPEPFLEDLNKCCFVGGYSGFLRRCIVEGIQGRILDTELE